MRYSAFTENNGILHLTAHADDPQHMLMTRGIYIRIRYCAFALAGYGRFGREHFRGPDAIFKHAFALDTHFLVSRQSANSSASLSCIL